MTSFFASAEEPRGALLVLSGSSGRVEKDRVRALADHGFAALSFRWFGGPGQPPGICEVPLETFAPALDELAGYADRLGVLGVSKGAEAALLLACTDPRVDVVAALSPPSTVWANVGPGLDGVAHPYRSSWSRGGEPLPFVGYDDTWEPPEGDGPTAFRELYVRSGQAAAEEAGIPAERIVGQVILTAGGDDQVWPSETYVHQLAARRAGHGLDTEVIVHPAAGHRLVLPGEVPPAPSPVNAHGGTDAADRELGARLLEALLRAFPPGRR
ncbi:MAG: acyl-CoA thioester hydrolase/BAAT C-terminal domain-containing protein [Nocardioidaceae bacterium]